jgi:cytochrome b
MKSIKQVDVWDPAVRVFHWSLVIAFAIAFVTEDEWLSLHVQAGYTVLGLVTFRILWGFIGPAHARFSNFVMSPSQVVSYLKDTLRLRGRRYIGHNPAGGAMIVLLLLSLLVASFTGLALYGVENQAGPLAGWFTGRIPLGEEGWEEVHEFAANFTLFLVLVHVAGVLIESFLHRENLVGAMFTGRKKAEQR